VKVLRHHLSSCGFKVRSVTTGEDAVKEVSKTMFDIVFLDVYMPGIGGIEAARQISKLPSPPRMIVGCSADTRGSIIAECMAAGMTEFLPKPFKKQVLGPLYSSIVIMKQIEKENNSNNNDESTTTSDDDDKSTTNSPCCTNSEENIDVASMDKAGGGGVVGEKSGVTFVEDLQKIDFKISQDNISAHMKK